jgi:superfamily II DNA or RNA helicase
VEIELNTEDSSILDMNCTCFSKFGCKHAAAVLMTAFASLSTAFAARSLADLPVPVIDGLTKLKNALNGGGLQKSAEPLLYIFKEYGRNLNVEVRRPSLKKNGKLGLGKMFAIDNLRYDSQLTPEDEAIVNLWFSGMAYSYRYEGQLPSNADIASLIVKKIVETGRCHWRHPDNPALKPGLPLAGRLEWTEQPNGSQKLGLSISSDSNSRIVIAAPCLCYIDMSTWECGPVDAPCAPSVVQAAMLVPEIAPEEAEALPMWLAANAPQIPAPRTRHRLEKRVLAPKPRLWLETQSVKLPMPNGKVEVKPIDMAVLTFDWPDHVSNPQFHRRAFVEGDTRVIETCDTSAENRITHELAQQGFQKLYDPAAYGLKGKADYLVGVGPTAWFSLLQNQEKLQEEKGWTIATSPTFRLQLVEAEEEWDSSVEQGSDWWLSLDVGVKVDGERVPLLPLLRQGLDSLPGDPTITDIEMLSVNGKFIAKLPDGRLLTLPFERVKPIFETLFELLTAGDAFTGDGLNVSVAHAAQLMKTANAENLIWQGHARLLELSRRLSSFSGIKNVDAPPSFNAELRAYQRDGLSWLQFLSEYNIGGILADDMGLGKTVQGLAHILLEKTSGRMEGPFLVICPTSVLPNWISEARKFAPDLKVLALHGPERSRSFTEIKNCDAVISTYPLLARDADVLLPIKWHGVILDEAQAIKNSKTNLAEVAYKLKANHKICMTGTPIENHLGELWSQFTFLMPGMLGTKSAFTSQFRTPIEKYNDVFLQKLLSSRLAPFILRRTKSAVAAELPEKTTIIQRVELEGRQRDLYETVRLAMQKAVRDEISAKGIGRSTIMILDALLKLRQVCCDPRLLKIPSAQKVEKSAKLTALMEMLPELIEEGRRVILFSQFTSMLDLIRVELDKRKIEYVELRGDTRDRKTPVMAFQEGQVPLFLISLKAGGTGLNLTAADTVIHYDPWWNPAVEDQATDRAHRIGQTKNVFVYKLIAEGTLEERMLQLQERKRGLANALFDAEKSASIQFTEDDLELLFRPLGS